MPNRPTPPAPPKADETPSPPKEVTPPAPPKAEFEGPRLKKGLVFRGKIYKKGTPQPELPEPLKKYC